MTIRVYQYSGRDEWLADRPNFVGGSDVASILGLPGAYRSRFDVWLEKRGQKVERKVSPSAQERMDWGNRLEGVVVQAVEEIHGGKAVHFDNVVCRGPEGQPRHRATLDGIWSQVEGGGDARPLEIKCVDGLFREEWAAGPPINFVCQCQWQLYCTDYERLTIAALIGGNQLVMHEVQRDQGLIDDLVAAIDRFWRDVDEGIAPPVEARDVTLLPRLYQARRGEQINVDIDAAAALAKAAAERERANDEFDRCKAALMKHMGPATEAVVDGKAFATWRTDKRGCRRFRLSSAAQEVASARFSHA